MITSAAIQNVVADIFGVTRTDIIGQCRARKYVRPRQVAMFVTRQLTSLSTTHIGLRFGHRDHTTCLHALTKVMQLARSDPDFRELVGRCIMAACALEEIYTTNAIEEASRMIHDQETPLRYPQAHAQGPLGPTEVGGTGSAREDQAEVIGPADVDREAALSSPR